MFENELNKVYEVIDEKDCTIASLKYVMSWKTNAMSVIFGPQWTYY